MRRARIREELPDDHPQTLNELTAALDRLSDPLELTSDEVVGSLKLVARLRNRLEAYETALAGEADSRKLGQVYGAGTTGTLVAAATASNPAIGSAIAGSARALRDMTFVAGAFAQGRLSAWHVQAFRHAAPRIDDFHGYEASLVEVAATVEPAELRRALDQLISQCTPEGPDRDFEKQRGKRGLWLSEMPNGVFRLDGYLDGVEGRKLQDSLWSFSTPGGTGDARSSSQRNADALADIVAIAQAKTKPLGVSGLSVLIDIEHLPEGLGALLDDGTRVGPTTFELLSCTVALACIFGVSRKGGFVPLALARSARRATSAQWAALIARDRGCIRCGRHPRACEAHHIVHWRDGGLTDVSNLVLMCNRCHADLHLGHYAVTIGHDGIPTITVNRGPPRSRLG